MEGRAVLFDEIHCVRTVMAMRREDMSDDELQRQAALERTWVGA